MKRHFSANRADRPGICSNRNPIRQNSGTFLWIPQKVIGHFFEDTWVRASVRPSVRPSIRPSVRPSVRPSIRPSVRAYVRMYVIERSESSEASLAKRVERSE